MHSRFFKTIGLIAFSVLYFVTSCLFGFSFATTYSVGYANVEDAVYYIKNYSYGLYIKDLDYFSTILGTYGVDSQYHWEFIYVSDGYYNIRNSYTGKYLTAPNDNNVGSLIQQEPLSTEYTNRQLWSITPAYIGGTSYYIQAKSQEGNNLFLVSNNTMGSYGYDLIQSGHTYDYRDEWLLEEAPKVNLIGINYGSSYVSSINSASIDFINEGYVTTALTPTSINVTTVKAYMEDSDVFILRSTGGYDENGTYMWLNNTLTLPYLHSWDIYNYNGNSGIDMSDCDVAVFAGCYTSYMTQGLPQSAVNAGAQCGIGFSDDPTASELNLWVAAFSEEYVVDNDIRNAVEYAIIEAGDSYAINLIDIIEQGG